MDDRRRKRIAENEALYRTVNEKIEDVSLAFAPLTETMGVVCECGDIECVDQIDIDVTEYERIRSDPTFFIVKPGHELPEVESVVDRQDAFNVVCKDQPVGEAVAIATDPRA